MNMYRMFYNYPPVVTSNSYYKTRFRVPTLNDVRSFFLWKFNSGPTVRVLWPTNPSSDPNEAYRPWLQENVGRQFIDWDWTGCFDQIDTISIKLHKKHATLASVIALKWA